MQGEKSTCLSPTKTTLMFFHPCSLILLILKTYKQQLNLLLEANIGHKHMQSRQTRTTKNNTPIKKRLKKRIGFGSRNTNARNAENETMVEKITIERFKL
jgi:hypothetical protein